MPTTSKRTEKIQISLAPEEIGKIDQWQFDNRIPSRAAAIRELIGRSIRTEAKLTDDRAKSRDFGVFETKAVREGRPSFTVADALNPELPLIYVSPGFTDLCEYTSDEVIGRNCRFLQGPETDRETVAELRSGLKASEAVEVKLVNYRKSGGAYLVRVQIEPVFSDRLERPLLFVGVQTFLEDL